MRRYAVHDKRRACRREREKALRSMLSDFHAGAIFPVLVVWHSHRLERRGGRQLLNLLSEGRGK